MIKSFEEYKEYTKQIQNTISDFSEKHEVRIQALQNENALYKERLSKANMVIGSLKGDSVCDFSQ